MNVTISKTDLARHTREILDQVRDGKTVLVRSYGEDQIVLMDALDYQLLRSLAAYALRERADDAGDPISQAVHRYLDEQISLAKSAELVGVSRFELMERFERLGMPLRLGSEGIVEMQDEVSSARQAKKQVS